MPRFYFNIREGNRLTRDEEGLDLPGLDAAQREAEMSGREILADMLRDGTPLDGQARSRSRTKMASCSGELASSLSSG